MNPENAGEILLLDESSEKPLLRRITNGDENAFRKCVEKHGNMIWQMARRCTDSEADAETVTLEIFREIWKCAANADSENCAEDVFIRRIAYRSIFKIRENP